MYHKIWSGGALRLRCKKWLMYRRRWYCRYDASIRTSIRKSPCRKWYFVYMCRSKNNMVRRVSGRYIVELYIYVYIYIPLQAYYWFFNYITFNMISHSSSYLTLALSTFITLNLFQSPVAWLGPLF